MALGSSIVAASVGGTVAGGMFAAKANANNLGIGDLTNGVSASGASDYVEGINTKAIEGAIKALQSTETVTKALQGGWQGAAEMNFEKNLYNAVNTAIDTLRIVENGIESLVSDLVEDMANQDANMVEVEDVVSFN